MAGQIQMLQETINQVVKGKQKVVENKESMPTQTQEKNEIVTPPSTETKEETMNEEKTNKFKRIVQNIQERFGNSV